MRYGGYCEILSETTPKCTQTRSTFIKIEFNSTMPTKTGSKALPNMAIVSCKWILAITCKKLDHSYTKRSCKQTRVVDKVRTVVAFYSSGSLSTVSKAKHEQNTQDRLSVAPCDQTAYS